MSLKQIALTVSAEKDRISGGSERERVDSQRDGRKMDKSARVMCEKVAYGQIHTSLRLPDKAPKPDENVYKNAFGANNLKGIAFYL